MRIVIADTGPLNYLILIEQADILAALFDAILIPDAVRRELTRRAAPASVQAWMAAAPPWLSIRPDTGVGDADLQRLGEGEREAILLALASRADLLLMDDRAGVAAARTRGLTIVGTLGLIDLAARSKLLDVKEAVMRLRATNFRCRPEMLDGLLDRHRGS